MTDIWSPAQPHSWWTVETVAVGMSRGITLYYRLGPRQPLRDEHGRWARDAAGRTALEAFGALPLDEMYGRLREGDEAWLALDLETRAASVKADPEREPRRWLKALAELDAFVKKFGPLGFDWSRTFPVANPDADRALGARVPNRRWQVVFPSPGFPTATVGPVYINRGTTWEEGVRLGDDGLPHDFLGPEPSGPLWGQQDDLRRVLQLVKVLGEPVPDSFDIKAAAGNLPGFGEYDVRDHGARDPVDVRWRDAMRSPREMGGRPWAPFREHHTSVKWPTFGRLSLVNYLTRQLAWTTIEAGFDELGRIRTRWTPHSLMEVIYLQLLEHVEERLQFGVGECLLCHGPILRTRLSARTRNRAHRGCAAVLRKRRQRDRERHAVPAESPA